MLVSPSDLFHTKRNLPHGHVEAVLGAIRKLYLDTAISAKRCPERDLVVAMIAARLIHPFPGGLRVSVHTFLCLLAFQVEWRMRRALAPLLCEDEDLPEDRKRPDPILPAKASASAKLNHLRLEGEGFQPSSKGTLILESRCNSSLCKLPVKFPGLYSPAGVD